MKKRKRKQAKRKKQTKQKLRFPTESANIYTRRSGPAMGSKSAFPLSSFQKSPQRNKENKQQNPKSSLEKVGDG